MEDHSEDGDLVNIETLDANYKALLKGPVRLLQVCVVYKYAQLLNQCIFFMVDVRLFSSWRVIRHCNLLLCWTYMDCVWSL